MSFLPFFTPQKQAVQQRIPLVKAAYHKNTSVLQKVNARLNCVIGAFAGGCIGYWGYTYYHYLTYPAQYAAPWYTSCLIYSGISTVIVAVTVGLKLILRAYANKKAAQDKHR